MTPGARVAAAITVLDSIGTGLPAEQALTRWARHSRFAGSKDRAAVRDHVFDVLRRRRSAAHFGGGESGRALMIGNLRQQGADLEALFSGAGHAPAPLSAIDGAGDRPDPDKGTLWNLPDWILPELERSLGDGSEATALALQERAPVSLRVNRGMSSREQAAKALEEEGVLTRTNPLSDAALTVTDGARRLRNSKSFQDGLVEMQDASSQAVVDALPEGLRVLDYCAGGGGKALAIAARGRSVFAHDADPGRMRDLPARAARAGVDIAQLAPDQIARNAPFDIVLCDVPCSGSGAWRRSPEGKWTLTQTRLDALNTLQDDILDRAAPLVSETGCLAYATCSVFRCENEDRVAAFLERHPGWAVTFQRRFDVTQNGDGFFTTHLTRVKL